MRSIGVKLHRYAGLWLAVFLFVSGVTGAVIAFQEELDRWLNPGWFRARAAGADMPLSAIATTLERQYPEAAVGRIIFPKEPQGTLRISLDPKPLRDSTAELAVDQLYVDPVSGEVLGARKWGAVRFDRAHLIPFIYQLHYAWHLGRWGEWLLGAVALLWVFDCFIGLYLAWPRRSWPAVKRALGVKWHGETARVHYDVHRAGGLWFWAVLLTLAVSGVYFNLNQEVFRPVLSTFTTITPMPGEGSPPRPNPAAAPAVDWDEALVHAATALHRAGASGRPGGIRYVASSGTYMVGFYTADDISASYPGTYVFVEGDSGRALGVQRPNEGTAGDVIMQWQFPLHSGQAFGLPGRILILLTGLVVAALSVTGVAIWWKKRSIRAQTDQKNRVVAEEHARITAT